MRKMARIAILLLVSWSVLTSGALAQGPITEYVVLPTATEPPAITGVNYVTTTTTTTTTQPAQGCATCGTDGHGGNSFCDRLQNNFVVRWIHSYGFFCGNNQCTLGCGGIKSQLSFMFGSCRSFFVESCPNCDYHCYGLVPPGVIECPTCR